MLPESQAVPLSSIAITSPAAPAVRARAGNPAQPSEATGPLALHLRLLQGLWIDPAGGGHRRQGFLAAELRHGLAAAGAGGLAAASEGQQPQGDRGQRQPARRSAAPSA
jgi:hypothetical protein